MKKLLWILAGSLMMVLPVMGSSVMAISETQESNIAAHCEEIREKLKDVQKTDAKSRVYLGGYYELILNNFIMPLNVRLIENNLPNADLVESQNEIVEARSLFGDDFVTYQQSLEELIAIDCKNAPGEFYTKLEVVRQKREIMQQDTLKVRTLISGYLNMVSGLKGKL